ncbi:ac108-like protein [Cryptophlebia peltastica nucleopolyhedrovirus]|uniref:Ac108-like protein n=1 Tax=Cryptophlebia peltastica nucleopolyhedrovirus TaxID=2304025 RepID=A0A346RNV4_9ABAC|nr:ac108-like protein [Cryptophlebia peltastica nucleopolyhedrovirus]AXS67751.1 ac108-like protein [Cryptophlebia peltastica nucleopolyhedrovirus]
MRRTQQTTITAFDQLQHLITRNQSFYKDFLLFICVLVVFIIILLFIILLFVLTKNAYERRETFASNLDYRNRM